MALKNLKKKFTNSELPSFILELKLISEELNVSPRYNQSAHYLGPVFFGCEEKHPHPHALNLGNVRHSHFSGSSTENILQDLFLPAATVVDKRSEKKPVVHPVIQRLKLIPDNYPHKCPGLRKTFVPELVSQEVNLGQTVSVIEGEKSQEIPICCIKKVFSTTGETEFEILTLSDFREKELKYKPHRERIAHAHFPKQFVSVRIVGPTIPAALTITKLPSKRKPQYDFSIHGTAVETKANKEESVLIRNDIEVIVNESDLKTVEIVFATPYDMFADTKEDERTNEIEENNVDSIQKKSMGETAKKTRKEAGEEEENVEEERGNPDFPEEVVE